jgi:tRNA nucleotidyltransferase/poly(A) polymerase
LDDYIIIGIENLYPIKNLLDKFMEGHKGFIAGGCFKNIINGEKVKDIDVFFENASDFESAVEYFDGYCGEGNEGGIFRFYYETETVKAYKHVANI